MLERPISAEQRKSSVELRDIVGDMVERPYRISQATACIEKLGIDYTERRLYKRGPGMRLPCLLCDDDGQTVKCLLLDISATGAKVKLETGGSDGERVDLSTVRRLGVASLVHFPVEVAWQDGSFVGLRFLSDAQEATEAINELLPQCDPFDDIETDAA